MDKAVLVTGANGFIAETSDEVLSAAGHLVFTHSRGEGNVDLLVSMTFQREWGIFNAGSGLSWGVDDIIPIVNELSPAPKAVRSEACLRQEEILNVGADISRVRGKYGWESRVAFRDGLRDTLAWIQASRIL